MDIELSNIEINNELLIKLDPLIKLKKRITQISNESDEALIRIKKNYELNLKQIEEQSAKLISGEGKLQSDFVNNKDCEEIAHKGISDFWIKSSNE